jgi:hypothetical protein
MRLRVHADDAEPDATVIDGDLDAAVIALADKDALLQRRIEGWCLQLTQAKAWAAANAMLLSIITLVVRAAVVDGALLRLGLALALVRPTPHRHRQDLNAAPPRARHAATMVAPPLSGIDALWPVHRLSAFK